VTDDQTDQTDPPVPNDIDTLRTQIAETRADLAGTVDALSAKANVKARAGRKIGDVEHTIAEKAGPHRTALTIGAAVATVGAVAGIVLLRRRRRH